MIFGLSNPKIGRDQMGQLNLAILVPPKINMIENVGKDQRINRMIFNFNTSERCDQHGAALISSKDNPWRTECVSIAIYLTWVVNALQACLGCV